MIFGTKMANSLKLLYEVHSFSTSPNSRQCTAGPALHMKRKLPPTRLHIT